MNSMAELEQVKRRAREALSLRMPGASPRATFIIHMGSEGIAAGAREVLLAVLDELNRRKITDCAVTQTDFTGYGMRPPVMDVLVPGKPAEIYVGVTPEDARKVVIRSVVKERVAAV